jgi:RNA polymerase sigma-70 factor, ECF subfamily
MTAPGVGGLVEGLFRREAGRLTGSLARRLGPGSLDLAEDCVQFAMVQALRLWPFEGVPEAPAAWLSRVARNRAFDEVRRGGGAAVAVPVDDLADTLAAPQTSGDPRFVGEIGDERLELMFACCHPVLARPSRVALTLKTVCGFAVPEIARAFLSTEPTIAQRLVRAKRTLGEAKIGFEIPGPADLPARLGSVLEVVYLIFGEGHGATEGPDLTRPGLCAEAIDLVSLLLANPVTATHEAHALAALMCLHAARLPARTDAVGEILTLEHQDRTLWDRGLVARGFRHLDASAGGDRVTSYHHQAAIAATHAAASSFAATDWAAVAAHYDALATLDPSPVVTLNAAVAHAMADGPDAGLAWLADTGDDLDRHHLRHAVEGELRMRAGDAAGAVACFRRARALAGSEPERRFLAGRLVAAAQA